MNKSKAFTLAEVLITLLIIGVVAALTIPPLISKYRKRVVETRLLNFYTKINEAVKLSELENGDKTTWEFPHYNNYEESYEFFNKYLKNYVKILKTEKHNENLVIYFYDGSAAEVKGRDWSLYIYSHNIDKTQPILGKDIFKFGFYTNTIFGCPFVSEVYNNKGIEPYVVDHPKRNGVKNSKECTSEADIHDYTQELYTRAIYENHWKIPDDYPIKL